MMTVASFQHKYRLLCIGNGLVSTRWSGFTGNFKAVWSKRRNKKANRYCINRPALLMKKEKDKQTLFTLFFFH
jgi:hypothetical protein